MSELTFRYAGWILVDVRLVAALAVFCASVAVIVLAVFFRGRRWDEYVVGFVAVFCLAMMTTLLITNAIGSFPALRLETFFPVH